MEAALVAEFLRTLPDRPADTRTVPRMRAYLEALGRPDVRYLVGTIRGAGAPLIARYARGVLGAAGASVQVAGDPLDEPLLARSGTAVAAIAYQLGALRPELGEVSRRDAETLLLFVAAAEASRRVLLLLDEDLDDHAPLHGAIPDVVAVGGAADRAFERALDDVPERRPLVGAERPALRGHADAEDRARSRGVALIAGGRDFVAARAGAALALAVGDERYPELALGADDDPQLAATGVVTALTLAAAGVRMRPEWVVAGAAAAAATMSG